MPMSSVALQNSVAGKYYNQRHDKTIKARVVNRQERPQALRPARHDAAAGQRIWRLINADNVMDVRRPALRQSNIVNVMTLLSLLRPSLPLGSLSSAAESAGPVSTALTAGLAPAALTVSPVALYPPLQGNANVRGRASLPPGNARAKRSAEAGSHERMDDMLIIKTAENSYPSSVNALNELYQFIAVIKNEKMANEAYGLLSTAKRVCYQGEHLLEAARLAKNDLDSHEKYIKENKFSARHLRKLKNVADDLRNDVIKEAWNAYQSFRVCYTLAKSEKKIEAIIKKISKTYDQQQGVAVAVVEGELSKNSHVLGLTEQKLNKILSDMQDAISAYTQQDKAAYYQEIIANGHPGIVVLALALKHEPWSSLPAGADGKPRHLSLIDNADKDFIAKVVMPYEEQAKRALEQRGADPLQKLASSASAAGTVAVGAGAVYVMSKKRQTQTPLEMRALADEARADFPVAGDDTTVLAQEPVMAPITDEAATSGAELTAELTAEPAAELAEEPAEETVADMALETVEEAVVENLEVEAAEAGTLLGGPVGGLIALAAIEAAKEVGEAVIESAVESAGDAVSETLQEAVGAAVKSAAAATTDDATADAAGITAGEAVVDSVVEKINERVKGRLSDKLKKRLGGN